MHLERQVQIERGSEREEEKWRERGGETDRQTSRLKYEVVESESRGDDRQKREIRDKSERAGVSESKNQRDTRHSDSNADIACYVSQSLNAIIFDIFQNIEKIRGKTVKLANLRSPVPEI